LQLWQQHSQQQPPLCQLRRNHQQGKRSRKVKNNTKLTQFGNDMIKLIGKLKLYKAVG
jgi:hypothetical protein